MNRVAEETDQTDKNAIAPLAIISTVECRRERERENRKKTIKLMIHWGRLDPVVSHRTHTIVEQVNNYVGKAATQSKEQRVSNNSVWP